MFDRPEQYIKIIEALSSVNRGISRDEIIRITSIPGSGSLTRKLDELENCGFIRKYIPYGYKSRNCLYQLIDNFTLFYFKFLRGTPSDDNFWSTQSSSPKIKAWSGLAFERICLEHTAQIKAALGIAGVHTEVNAWQCSADPEKGVQGSQIDLLIARKDQIINICEMKYSDTGYVVDSAFDSSLRRKISDFKIKTETKYSIHPVLVTTYAVGNSSYASNLQAVITADDLFS